MEPNITEALADVELFIGRAKEAGAFSPEFADSLRSWAIAEAALGLTWENDDHVGVRLLEIATSVDKTPWQRGAPVSAAIFDADFMLRAAATARLSDGERLPPLLGDFVHRVLTGVHRQPVIRGRQHPAKNWLRDAVLVEAIERLVVQGLRPTRNRASRHKQGGGESACSLVVLALRSVGMGHQSEDAIEKIWNERAELPPNPFAIKSPKPTTLTPIAPSAFGRRN